MTRSLIICYTFPQSGLQERIAKLNFFARTIMTVAVSRDLCIPLYNDENDYVDTKNVMMIMMN